MIRTRNRLLLAIGLCFFTFTYSNATPLEMCKKKISDLAEHGKKVASERGLKGVLDKAQIGSLRTTGDKTSLTACDKTLEKLVALVKTVEEKSEAEKK